MAIIEAKNLTKVYNDDGAQTIALAGVSFKIEAGEFVAIMGPSGSGKSTLLHILGFLDRHSDGQYFFDGKTINDYSSEEIAHVRNKKMGFVFQAFNLLSRMSVLENVKLPLLYSDIPESQWDELAKKAIAAVNLTHRLNYDTSQLSGGEKQRVAIALALVNDPQVVFADEPTGNLDSKSGRIIMDILQKLNDETKHTVILITHETYTAQHAQRILWMKDGLIESDKLVTNRLRAVDGFVK